jgi:multiple sugar transport system substrate-binding protein
MSKFGRNYSIDPRAASMALALGLLASAPAAIAQEAWMGVDDGTVLTLWSRAATQDRAAALIEAYNATHQNQIEVVFVPTDDYQTRVGAAAAAGGLPDLFSADVVFMPNWTSAGLFTPITDRIEAIPFEDQIAQAAIDVSTWDGEKYGLPYVVDLSVWVYNKALYREAGLDPESPPQTFGEFVEHARAIAALNKPGVSGTFFGGNCGGCNVFTWWPIAWADGVQIMNPEGTEAYLNNETMRTIYSAFREMAADGTLLMPDSETEAGPTWTGYFPRGVIGIMPFPATLQGLANADLPLEDIGITSIKGINGGESTFVGGDAIGISRDSQKVDQAWNFLAWLMTEEAQVGVVARQGNVVARADLAANEFSSADPRLVLFNSIAAKGQTPFAINFGATYNDPQGPWIPLFRNAIFGDGQQIDSLNDEITRSLQD